jgi:hypothetical protein
MIGVEMKRLFVIVLIGFIVYFAVGTALYWTTPDSLAGVVYTDGLNFASRLHSLTTAGTVFCIPVVYWTNFEGDECFGWVPVSIATGGIALGVFFGRKARRNTRRIQTGTPA